jgi:hypothetical protein
MTPDTSSQSEPQLAVTPCWIVADRSAQIVSVEFAETIAPIGGALYEAVVLPVEGTPKIIWRHPLPQWICDRLSEYGVAPQTVSHVMMHIGGGAHEFYWSRLDTPDGVLYYTCTLPF